MKHTTPLEREILTHYWCSDEEYPGPWLGPQRAAICRFTEMRLLYGIINSTDRTPISANREALAPYMEALASVPLPEQVWVVP